MADPFVGEIRVFAGNFAPRNWALCNGQLLPIAQNTALFSLLGTTYGGDGRSTFALPDLRGSAPLGFGQGPGLSNQPEGSVGGIASVTLIAQQVPAHAHQFMAFPSGRGGAPVATVTGAVPTTVASPSVVYSDAAANTSMNSLMVQPTPAGSHNNMQPYVGLNFIIALQGVFPPRS